MKVETLTPEKLGQASEMLKAMAHPVRLAIVELLGEKKELSVTEIYGKLGIEQAVASHQLGILKNKGLLTSVRDGKSTLYSLKHERVSQIIRCIGQCTK